MLAPPYRRPADGAGAGSVPSGGQPGLDTEDAMTTPLDTARNPTAEIGVTGLAVMGRNLARNLARHGFTVALHNRTTARTRALVDEFGDEGRFVATDSIEQFVAAIARPRKVLIMVKAGEATDTVISELVPLLDVDDVVIDGGNAHFEDTRRREADLRWHGPHFVGAGVSGGEEGAL